MIDGWTILAVALGYVGILFAIAWIGDRREQASLSAAQPGTKASKKVGTVIYALTLAVYCTSWTFFGSVGLAATSGLGFIPVYLGASLMIGLCVPFMIRMVRLAKSQNITSIADFIAARYGKSQTLAALVTIIAVVGTIPYIALQLKAAAASVEVLLRPYASADLATSALTWSLAPAGDMAFLIALSMAAFTIAFGTRHIDATEHQGGLMLAVAAESIVKLIAFLCVGLFVTYIMFDGFADLWAKASAAGHVRDTVDEGWSLSRGITITVLSFVCILLLPRQFHVAVVENQSERDVRTAAWLFPLYLIAINVFVLPIALAGLLIFEPGTVDADMFVLALPLSAGANTLAMFAFIGGLSAATAMVIVASIALAIMVCNEIIVPFMLRRAALRPTAQNDVAEIGPLLLNIRRMTIIVIMLLAYGFHRTMGQSAALASIGLLSFSAIAQFAPAFFAGLVWRRATARGAIAGITAGFLVWSWTMLVPWVATAGWIAPGLIEAGPFGIAWLRPEALFGAEMTPLVHGVFWSLVINTLTFAIVSLSRDPQPVERLQANVFLSDQPGGASPSPTFKLWRSSITVDDLQRTAARFVGNARAERSFQQYASENDVPRDGSATADVEIIRFTERLLASAIGAASSRLVLSLLMRRRDVGYGSALKLLDDASEAIQYNRVLLQSALDQMGQGISVFDDDLRLICWNRSFREVMDLPSEFGAVGVPLDRIIQHKIDAGHYGPRDQEDFDAESVRDQLVTRIALANERFQDTNQTTGRVLEIAGSKMPQGGIVTTYTDITERVDAAAALARANESLERRVNERTAQLTEMNEELGRAKRKADEANLDKTRFLAAASHDLLQPLNAARLYAGSLSERARNTDADDLSQRIDASLEAVEEIIGALLDISRLDAKALKPDFGVFPIGDLFERLRLEFEPLAASKGLRLRFVQSSAWMQSDRRLLRRILQNLISNAIKYTETGSVLVGCRRDGDQVSVQVLDTGSGIDAKDRAVIFKEFHRLDGAAQSVRGLGLGLSIVQRIAAVLDHPVEVESIVGRGTLFSVSIPRRPQGVRSIEDRRPRPMGHDVSGTIVLVIDNERDIVEGTHLLLSGWGCQVITAESEQEALERLRDDDITPDLILADYHLTDTLGTATVRAIQNALGRDVPAIIITADRTAEITEEIAAMNLTVMRKPVRPAALRAAIYQMRESPVAAAE